MSLIGQPRKGFNVMAYNKQKRDREQKTMTMSDPYFETWLAECRQIIMRTLGHSAELADKMIAGAGRQIYLAKFGRGMTPQQSVDDELIYWNE